MHTIAADVFATQGAKASVIISLAELFRIIPVSSPRALTAQQIDIKIYGKQHQLWHPNLIQIIISCN